MKAYEDHVIAERDGVTLNSSFGASRLQLVAAKRALMASNPIPGWKSQEEEQQEAADVAALARYAMGLREADYDGDASCAWAPRYIQIYGRGLRSAPELKFKRWQLPQVRNRT